MTTPELPFTGERFTPECVREIWLEHWHRYAFALPLARGKRVLDAACGEGYGSALLAEHCGSVVGLDISEQAIAHAKSRYGDQSRLTFEQADVAKLEHLPDASFDLIVSFETLEHLAAQEAMLDGFARLLAPGGVLLVSTPDRLTYSDLPGFNNEHHVRELYREEFEALLAPRFAAIQLFGQKLLFQSALWRVDSCHHAPASVAATTLSGDARPVDGLDYAPLYYIAACASDARALDGLPSMHWFGDAAESVYRHYEDEIRKGIRAGHRLIELEAALANERSVRATLEREVEELKINARTSTD